MPAVALRMSRPTSVEPVKAILSTSGWCDEGRAGGAVAGDDVDHTRRQAGLVRSISAKQQRGQRGVLGGLEHHGVAAASAGAIFHASISSGKFHGMIWPHHAQRAVLREFAGQAAAPSRRGDRSGGRPAGCRCRAIRGSACRCPASPARRAIGCGVCSVRAMAYSTRGAPPWPERRPCRQGRLRPPVRPGRRLRLAPALIAARRLPVAGLMLSKCGSASRHWPPIQMAEALLVRSQPVERRRGGFGRRAVVHGAHDVANRRRRRACGVPVVRAAGDARRRCRRRATWCSSWRSMSVSRLEAPKRNRSGTSQLRAQFLLHQGQVLRGQSRVSRCRPRVCSRHESRCSRGTRGSRAPSPARRGAWH